MGLIKTPMGKIYHTGRVEPPPHVLAQRHLEAMRRHGNLVDRLPDILAPTYDCIALGQVPPIRNQKQCGSCWDFSGTGVVTCANIIAGYGKPDGSFQLSEQYTLDCGQNGGCNGDDNVTVLEWAKKTGLPLDSAYGPYQANSERCAYKSSETLYTLDDWGYATPSQEQGVANTADIKTMMVQYGPIGSGIDASGLGDGTGIISGNGSSIDHDIVLVGWDDSKGKAGCWRLRNSWGTSWGDGGYCWIEYGAWSVGYEAVWGTRKPLAPPPPPVPPGPLPWVFDIRDVLLDAAGELMSRFGRRMAQRQSCKCK